MLALWLGHSGARLPLREAQRPPAFPETLDRCASGAGPLFLHSFGPISSRRAKRHPAADTMDEIRISIRIARCASQRHPICHGKEWKTNGMKLVSGMSLRDTLCSRTRHCVALVFRRDANCRTAGLVSRRRTFPAAQGPPWWSSYHVPTFEF